TPRAVEHAVLELPVALVRAHPASPMYARPSVMALPCTDEDCPNACPRSGGGTRAGMGRRAVRRLRNVTVLELIGGRLLLLLAALVGLVIFSFIAHGLHGTPVG